MSFWVSVHIKFSSVLSDGLIVDCCIDDIIASMSERNKAMVNVVFSLIILCMCVVNEVQSSVTLFLKQSSNLKLENEKT